MKEIKSLEMLQSTIAEQPMVLAYFTTTGCNVCKDLFPKMETMMESFPDAQLVRVEVDQMTELVGAYQVFMVPTVVLFVEGRETIRRARTFSVEEVAQQLDRYTDLVFGHGE